MSDTGSGNEPPENGGGSLAKEKISFHNKVFANKEKWLHERG